MNTKNSVEAFAKYHRSKEALAELTQIGTAAISLLKLNVAVPNGPSLLGEFVDSCQVQHWGKGKNFTSPVEKTSQIGEMFCRHILVQQVSAFDLFSISITSDLARFSSWARENLSELTHEHNLLNVSPQGRWVSSPCCNEIEDKIGDLKSRINDLGNIIGWAPTGKLREIIPLLDLARMARNRIVHSDSIVGAEFSEFSKSKEVILAFQAFQKNYAKGDIPSLPQWERGKVLTLSPANAIFFGAVLNEFAKEINRYAASKLTEKEYVQMAFYYGCFVETHPARTIRHRDTEGRIQNFLTSRYLFGNSSAIKDVLPFLKDPIQGVHGTKELTTSLWKIALSRHKELTEFEKRNLPPNGNAEAKKNKQKLASKNYMTKNID